MIHFKKSSLFFVSQILLSFLFDLSVASALTTNILSYDITSGESYAISLTPTDAVVKEIQLNLLASKKDAQLLKIDLVGPDNLRVQAQITPLLANGVQGKPYLIDLSKDGGKTLKSTVVIKNKQSAISKSSSTQAANAGCAGLSEGQIVFLTNLYNQLNSSSISTEQFCSLNAGGENNSGNTGDNNNGSSQDTTTGDTLYGLLLKDACNPKITQYQVSIKLLRDQLTAAQISENSEISVRATELANTKSNGASLKPKSDGKFNNPLYLGRTVGGYGTKETLHIVRWSGSKIKNILKVKKADTIYYKGAALARIPLTKKELKGGKATFILTNHLGQAHHSCFKNTSYPPKRQYSGNYPK